MGILGLGKILMGVGITIFLIGLFLVLGDKIPFFGRIPGDIFFQGKRFSFYFPVVTCIILSIIGSVVLGFFSRR